MINEVDTKGIYKAMATEAFKEAFQEAFGGDKPTHRPPWSKIEVVAHKLFADELPKGAELHDLDADGFSLFADFRLPEEIDMDIRKAITKILRDAGVRYPTAIYQDGAKTIVRRSTPKG